MFQGKWYVYDKLNFDDKLGFLKGPHQPKDIVLSDRVIKFKLFDLSVDSKVLWAETPRINQYAVKSNG